MRWTQAQLDNGLATLETLRDALSNSESERDHRTVTGKRFSRAAEWARIFKFLYDSIIAYLQRESVERVRRSNYETVFLQWLLSEIAQCDQ